MAMISTHPDVWLRPVLLGGFGGMSDRSFHLFRSLVECAGEEHANIEVVPGCDGDLLAHG